MAAWDADFRALLQGWSQCEIRLFSLETRNSDFHSEETVSMISVRSVPVIPVQNSDVIFSVCFQEGKVGPSMFKSVLIFMILPSHSRGHPWPHFRCREGSWLLNREIKMSFEFSIGTALGLRVT